MPQIDPQLLTRETVMDVTEEQIGLCVYAKAFLATAAKQPNARELVDEVRSLVDDVVTKMPRFEEMLRSSLVSGENKEQLLQRVFGGRVSETVLTFLKVLSRHNRLVLLRPISRQLQKLYTEALGLIDVHIRVASPLDPQLQQQIHDRLRERLGAEPVINISIDPSILAGIVIRAGDRVFDGSLATRVNQLRKTLVERVVERMETHPERFAV